MIENFFHFLVILCSCCLHVYADQYIECLSPEKHNTFVASQSSCSRYIYCDGESSFVGECLAGNYFNEAAGNCDDSIAVTCMVENTNGVTVGAITSDSTPNNNTLTSVVYSNSSTKISITSSTTAAVDTSMTTINKLPGIGNSLADIPQCPLHSKTQPHTTVYLPNSRSCSAYFICYYGIAIPMSCPEGYNFNGFLAKCERQEEFQCVLNRPARINCVKGVYDLMPHPDNCEYYYFCANGFLMIFECPYQFMWHFERRTCVHRSLAKCYVKSYMHDLLLLDRYSIDFM